MWTVDALALLINKVREKVDSLIVPTKVSDLVNDAGYVDAAGAASAAPVQSVNGNTGTVTISIPSVTYSYVTSSDKTVATGTYTQIGSFDYSAGITWAQIHAEYSSNATGDRLLLVSSANTATSPTQPTVSIRPAFITQRAVDGASTNMTVMFFVNGAGTAGTRYIYAYQNSGSSLTVSHIDIRTAYIA